MDELTGGKDVVDVFIVMIDDYSLVEDKDNYLLLPLQPTIPIKFTRTPYAVCHLLAGKRSQSRYKTMGHCRLGKYAYFRHTCLSISHETVLNQNGYLSFFNEGSLETKRNDTVSPSS